MGKRRFLKLGSEWPSRWEGLWAIVQFARAVSGGTVVLLLDSSSSYPIREWGGGLLLAALGLSCRDGGVSGEFPPVAGRFPAGRRDDLGPPGTEGQLPHGVLLEGLVAPGLRSLGYPVRIRRRHWVVALAVACGWMVCGRRRSAARMFDVNTGNWNEGAGWFIPFECSPRLDQGQDGNCCLPAPAGLREIGDRGAGG